MQVKAKEYLIELEKQNSEPFKKTEGSSYYLNRNLKRARSLYSQINAVETAYPNIEVKENFEKLLDKLYDYCEKNNYTLSEVKKINFQIFRFLNRLKLSKTSTSSFTTLFATKINQIEELVCFDRVDLIRVLNSEYFTNITSMYNNRGFISIEDFEIMLNHIEKINEIEGLDAKSYSGIQSGKGIMTETQFTSFQSQLTKLTYRNFWGDRFRLSSLWNYRIG